MNIIILDFLCEDNYGDNYSKESKYYKEDYFHDWFCLILFWNLNLYSKEWKIENCEMKLEIILKLSENTWEEEECIDEFEEWKEYLEETDNPDFFKSYPVYFCEIFMKDKEKILNNINFINYMNEKFCNLQVDYPNLFDL